MTWINNPRFEDKSLRQPHTDLPENTYRRELDTEGFYGPAAHQIYHYHPPTGGSGINGSMKPRAFDTRVGLDVAGVSESVV